MSRITACLIPMLCASAALVPSSVAKATTAPVAYVYVSRTNPDFIDALAASPAGALTYINDVSTPHPLIHLSVTKKFVFGIDGKSNIYSYSIAANGGLKYVASIDAAKYVKDASSTSSAPVLQVDETGSDVYAFVTDTNNNWYLLSFKIESNGELEFLGSAYANSYFSEIRFVQDNKYALYPSCDITVLRLGTESKVNAQTMVYKRESNGLLSYIGASDVEPEAQGPYQYCPDVSENDTTDHLAVSFALIDPTHNEFVGSAVGTYTVSATGKLTTTSNWENMPTVGYTPAVVSISPSSNILAVGGSGSYQFFHFNGANPITAYSGVINAGDQVRAFSWDKSNHAYMLTGSAVVPFSITTTSYKALTPYSISAPYSMIVLSLQ